MIVTLALRNLLRDRLRLAATLAGVAFSVILMTGQAAIYFGACETITTMIDRSNADLWVVPIGSQSFEDGLPLLTDSDRQRTAAVDGVSRVTPIVASFADWREPSGVIDSIVLVGSDPRTPGPHPSIPEDADRTLQSPKSVVVDSLYLNDLGVKGVGDSASIGGSSVRIAALSEGLRSFTQSPYVFARSAQTRKYLGLPPGSATFLLVETADHPSHVQKRLSGQLSQVDVLTPSEFRSRSLQTWLIKTGAGQALILGTILGAIIGGATIAQAANMSVHDHEAEFALLRCIGSSTAYLQCLVLVQAILVGAAGAIIGIGMFLGALPISQKTSLFLSATPGMLALIFLTTIGISLISSIHALRKVQRLDPAILLK